MTKIFITGSAQGLGRGAAEELLAAGHEVIVHARTPGRLAAVADLASRGAQVVVGDLADARQTRELAEQVNRLGAVYAVIHNAGVLSGPSLVAVNVLAPYLLTALVARPARLVYLSSGMHRGGRPRPDLLEGAASYSDTKLFVTTLAAAVARLWPDVLSNAVDPGWVPTRMGGAGAPDDLRLGHLTQTWLATSDDPDALTSGDYWHHRRRATPHPSAVDRAFQDQLLDRLARLTGTPLG